MHQDVLEKQLSRDELLALKNKRTGVTVFQISWIMVFVCLILVNLQIRSNAPSWPPPGVQGLEPILPTVATIGLLASALLARSALKAIGAEQHESFLEQWRLALALGAGFVLIMAYQWVSVQFSGQYSTIFRVMVAYHAVHALVIGYIMWRAYKTGQMGGYTVLRHWPVEAATRLWYFVVVAWVLFYIVLYIIQ
jgi:heme/copper-type cytochrome/quinol oxidase subunit 3